MTDHGKCRYCGERLQRPAQYEAKWEGETPPRRECQKSPVGHHVGLTAIGGRIYV